MRIAGLQKLSLLDYPEKICCTVFTRGCNFRCPFCHNAALVLPPYAPDALSEDDFFAFLATRRGRLDGVCITGGEPLLQPDLGAFLSRIKASGFSVKLDTNGTAPDVLRAFVREGLVDYVAMDIKNEPAQYPETAGCVDFDIAPVLQTADFLLSGAVPYEFRTTVVDELHDAHAIHEIGRWLTGASRYFLQAYVDSGDLIANGLHPAPPETMQQYLSIVQTYIPAAALRGTV